LNLDSETFAKKLFEEKGVLVVPGTAFGSEPELKEGLAILK